MILYHGSKEIVEYPEIRKAVFNKDFYFGFYCTQHKTQAERWATRFNYVQNFIDNKISRVAFWELTKFNHPTHQISFHTISALNTLTFLGSEEVYGYKK